jgi:DnaJ-class molecular chaperone
VGDTCRTCDGKGETLVRNDYDDVVGKRTCSRCYGKGVEPGPSKGDGKRRFFRKATKVKLDANELSLEQQADAFLSRHGFGRNGR